jgi:suppressor of ftsI
MLYNADLMKKARWLLTAVGLVALGTLTFKTSSLGASSGDGFPQPKERRSVNGLLFDTLSAAPGTVQVGTQTLSGALLYNGQYPAHLWRVKPGDRLRLLLENKIPGQSTNLHFHGFHVDPNGFSDNVFAEIPSGATRGYSVNIPDDHTSGLNWYHPHFHGNSNDQVHRGLAGLVVIEGDTDQLPEVRGLKERIMALEYLQTDGNNQIKPGGPSALQLVNGVLTPSMQARPGETQFFRAGNTSASGWFKLAVDNHKMRILAEDGNAYSQTEDVDFFLLPPGKRVEFLVQFSGPGTYSVRNQGYKWGGTTPAAELAKVVVAGDAMTPQALPTRVADRVERSGLLTAKVDRTRTITFDAQTDQSPVKFMVDQQTFDHDRIDISAKLDTVEEWELVNTTGDDHPFHIHINDFIITQINGQAVTNPRLQDTAVIPANGRITVRQRFEDFTGKWLMHCHILGHEDLGMMATVEVTK